MIVSELIRYLPAAIIHGDPHTDIKGVTADSRLVKPGWLFVAVVGMQSDGHQYVYEAKQKGASAVLVEHLMDIDLPQIVIERTQPLTGPIAAAVHGFPGEHLRITGVTGTKGKTSTCYMLDHLLRHCYRKTSLLCSIGGRVADRVLDPTLTTRPAAEIQELLAIAVNAGEEHLAMEVGSHSIVQRRITGVPFDTAIFTNISHEHLDYHGSMEKYYDAKASLFAWLGCCAWSSNPIKGRKTAIINHDEHIFTDMLERIAVPVFTYGFDSKSQIWADSIVFADDLTTFCVHWHDENYHVTLPLVGRFSVANALAALAGGITEGLPLKDMVEGLLHFPGVPGRFERIDHGQPFTVVVDYAHTEASLMQVLDTVREMTKGRVILVFGCTGERDKVKRPLMGALAVAKADYVIISSDDPHAEDPESIINDIVAGIPSGKENWSSQADRARAVVEALAVAEPGDFVLLAGKGHETVQVFGDYALPYSDQETARRTLAAMGYGGK